MKTAWEPCCPLAICHFLGWTNTMIAVQIKTKFCSFSMQSMEGHQGLDTRMLSLWRKFDFASSRGCMLNYILKDMNDNHANNCKYSVFGLYLSTILKPIRNPIHCVVVSHLNFYFSFFTTLPLHVFNGTAFPLQFL